MAKKLAAARAAPTRVSAAPNKHVLLMISTEHVHGRRILEGIADYAEHHQRWQVHLRTTVEPRWLRHEGIDGMIVEPLSGAIHAALNEVPIPAISVAHIPLRSGLPSVVVDNHAVGRMGAEHLADLGLKHLAFVHGMSGRWTDDRCAGFTEACKARRLPCSVFTQIRGDDEQEIGKWMLDLPAPVGIMAANDARALMVSRACRDIGRRIPEQVALIGVDNESETCRLADPPLSSIDHGTRRVGYEAAKLLDEWMAGRKPDGGAVRIGPVGVITRPSTDLLAIDDPDVVAALRFIRLRVDRPLKVNDVLQHVAMSRRSLELHFRRALGRTIHEEVTRVRIERAKQLLITSDWSIVHIGDACGFSFPSQFSFAFRRETGMPPAKFRDQYRFTRQLS